MADTVLAFGCHPDDIEFMMAGTLLLLRKAGCTLHYMNPANGSCGTSKHSREGIVGIREKESRSAASYVGAVFHPSLVDDVEVFYTGELTRRVTAVIRQVKPNIMLLLSPQDYMEDHMNSVRVGFTAAFCRGMVNYVSDPPVSATSQKVTLYHALPYGLTDILRRTIEPDFFVDVSSVMERKKEMLACHESQKAWLDESQGIDAYLQTMQEMSAEVGRMSGKFEYAEGWRRHSHLGFCDQDDDPLREILSEYCYPR